MFTPSNKRLLDNKLFDLMRNIKKSLSVAGIFILLSGRFLFAGDELLGISSLVDSSFAIVSMGTVTVEQELAFGNFEVPREGFDGTCAIRLNLDGSREVLQDRTTATNCLDSILTGENHGIGLLSFTGNLINIYSEGAVIGNEDNIFIEITLIRINDTEKYVEIGGEVAFLGGVQMNNGDDGLRSVVMPLEAVYE